MGKKKDKEKKKKKKKKKLLKRFTPERIMLIVVSVLLIFSVGYIAISSLNRSDGDDVDSTESDDVESAEEDSEEPDSEDVASAATPTPKRIALQPTATVRPSITEDDIRSHLNLDIPDGTHSFDRDEWYTYDTENATYELKDGQLVGIDHVPEETHTYYSEYRMRESGNVYAEISATIDDCVGKDSVGLVIRIDAETLPSGYAFEVACDGSFRFRSLRSNLASGILVNWTQSDVINAGPNQTNRLGIWGAAGSFIFYVNDEYVGEYYDYDYPDAYGGFAAYVRALQTYDLSATFDDFAFWHIPFIEGLYR